MKVRIGIYRGELLPQHIVVVKPTDMYYIVANNLSMQILRGHDFNHFACF